MTQAAHDGYQLPDGFEHCSKLRPVVEATSALDRVRAVVTVLAAPGGCPWDGKQTNRTLLRNLIEETYEYVDTVEADDREGMREELGDLLLQSVFQGVVCQKDSVDPFTLDEVCDRLVNKLITRHPAVFAPDSAQDADDGSGQSPEDVLKLWNEMKRKEKHRTSALEGISHSQGAFLRAAKVVHRVAGSDHADRLSAAFAAETSQAATGDTPESPTAAGLADDILTVIRRADAAGIDIDAALRSRLRAVEDEIVRLEHDLA